MKKLLIGTVTITACVALCAAVWPRPTMAENVPTQAQSPAVGTVIEAQEAETETVSLSVDEAKPEPVTTSADEQEPPEAVSIQPEEPPDEQIITPAHTPAPTTPAQEPSPQSHSSDPYRTDIYPNNVYSEELIYDEDGNLLRKVTTFPATFGPDTVWVDGRAYYNVPGFGLIEWSGPSTVIVDYTMYENGNKVGIMD